VTRTVAGEVTCVWPVGTSIPPGDTVGGGGGSMRGIGEPCGTGLLTADCGNTCAHAAAENITMIVASEKVRYVVWHGPHEPIRREIPHH
jgi:hypothetical protein